jgi:hypothetical protein
LGKIAAMKSADPGCDRVRSRVRGHELAKPFDAGALRFLVKRRATWCLILVVSQWNATRVKVTGALLAGSVAAVLLAYFASGDSEKHVTRPTRRCPSIPFKAPGPGASTEERFYGLEYLAREALTAQRLDQASAFATELLELAPRYPRNWNCGNAIHHGNTVLGRVALARGDVQEARRRLLASAETTGSPQLNSFGPSMALAESLLERGEIAIVLQYLERCKRFWKLGHDFLETWEADVTAGHMPQFRYNRCL